MIVLGFLLGVSATLGIQITFGLWLVRRIFREIHL